MWNYYGQQRPDFATPPGEQQESVWDYPRPPAQLACEQLVEVKTGNTTIASSTRCIRILETASPPTVYIPPDDVAFDQLKIKCAASFCEWKGAADYWALAEGNNTEAIGWSYPDPKAAFAPSVTGCVFTPAASSATSTANGSDRKKAVFTAAGLPAILLVRGRARPIREIGNA